MAGNINPNNIGDKSVAWLTQFVKDLIRQGASGVADPSAPPVITSFTPTTGGARDTVTITGQGFTFVTAVTFNGVPAATFTVVSDTSITAIVPMDASTGAIMLTNAGGTTASATTFTVSGLTWTNFASFDNNFRQSKSSDTGWALPNGTGGSAGTPYAGAWATTLDGFLVLRGAISTDFVGGTNNLTAFILPVGSRPASTIIFDIGSGVASRTNCVVQTTGVVVPYTAPQDTCLRFDGVTIPLN